MLARTFLPAANLKITEKQRDALIAVLLFFEGGKVKWREYRMNEGGNGVMSERPAAFNMADWNCGTTGCIGGWADVLGDAGFSDMDSMPKELEKLFYPPKDEMIYSGVLAYSEITLESATTALRNFLKRGDSDWASVLSS